MPAGSTPGRAAYAGTRRPGLQGTIGQMEVPTDARAPRSSPSLVTVAVCTYGRPAALRRCLASLRELDDSAFEILIVDNDPRGSVPETPVGHEVVRVIHEPRRGLDHARNRAVAEARGRIVAFIDDDCEADVGWLRGLRRPFDDPEVACVTGRVRPASLATAPQRWFEDRFSFDRGIVPDRFRATDHRPWFPLHPFQLGTGCNMAFRVDVVTALGGFDPALDMGTRVGGGGDIDVFARLLDAGGVAAYAPEAVVFHHHRQRRREAVRQFFGYGATVSALCAKAVSKRPGRRVEAIRFVVHYLVAQMRRLGAWARRREPVPLYLIVAETVGLFAGPLLYAVSLLENRRRTPA